MSLETEVLESSGVKRKSKEDEQDFLKRVVKKLAKLPDKEYNKLSPTVRNWHEEAVVAVNDGEEIPAISDGEPPPAKKRGRPAKAAPPPPEEDDEDEDGEWDDEAEAANDDGEDEEGVEDEDDESEDEDEEEDEEDEIDEAEEVKPKGKSKAAKKVASTAKAIKKGAEDAEKGTRGIRPRVPDDTKIKILKKYEGTGVKKQEQFKKYKDGATIGQLVAKGAKRRHILRDIRKGFLTVQK